MTKIQRLESEVKSLSAQELATFRVWYEKFDAESWDKQIEADAAAGKLDKLAAQAIADYNTGCRQGVRPRL